eukprot:TRINITY_DN767_c0_g1_i2.p1 TRINITY_DN767_c0_g1~~TRINITY_DN767_c0_g1_i2.p1  ORF type:complete len:1948 (+),score=368.57 TRINITY_DN767_c0_g1_i2:109-5952(+)
MMGRVELTIACFLASLCLAIEGSLSAAPIVGTISAIFPNQGPMAGGQVVTIEGHLSNGQDITSVTFGTSAAIVLQQSATVVIVETRAANTSSGIPVSVCVSSSSVVSSQLAGYIFTDGCFGVVQFPSSTASVSIQSGSTQMSPSSNCTWLFTPSVPHLFVLFTFSVFDTSYQDVLSVYSLTTGELLTTFAGGYLPAPSPVSGRHPLLLHFTSTNSTSVPHAGFVGTVSAVNATCVSASPPVGPVNGNGFFVVFEGAFPTDVSMVTLCGVYTIVEAWGEQSIEVWVSSGAPYACIGTAGNVTIEFDDGSSTTADNIFTFLLPGEITSVVPSAGFVSGQQYITIHGKNFSMNDDITQVWLGTQTAFVYEQTDTSVVVVTEYSGELGVVNITLQSTSHGSTIGYDMFEFLPVGTINATVPSSGPMSGGNLVTISGIGLGNGTDITSVILYCANAVIVSQSADVVVVNASTGTDCASDGYFGPVLVSSISCGTATESFGYRYTTGCYGQETFTTANGTFAVADYYPQNSNCSYLMSPSHLNGQLMLEFVKFGLSYDSASVYVYAFDTMQLLAAFDSNQETPLTSVSYIGPMYVWFSSGSSSSEGFVAVFYQTAGILNSPVPNGGPIAQPNNISLSGQNVSTYQHSDVLSVTVCGISALNIQVTGSSIECVVPAIGSQQSLADISCDIVVVSATYGRSELIAAYDYYAQPNILAVTPNIGSCSGGFDVTLFGQHVYGSDDVITVSLVGIPATVTSMFGSTEVIVTGSGCPLLLADVTGNVELCSKLRGCTTAYNNFTYVEVLALSDHGSLSDQQTSILGWAYFVVSIGTSSTISQISTMFTLTHPVTANVQLYGEVSALPTATSYGVNAVMYAGNTTGSLVYAFLPAGEAYYIAVYCSQSITFSLQNVALKQCSGTQIMSGTSGTFSDGSPSDGTGNVNCVWIIQPPANTSSITMSFNSLQLSIGTSSLVVETLDTQYTVYSSQNSYEPGELTYVGSTLQVTFTSTQQYGAAFVLSYTSQQQNTCNGTTVVTGWAATFGGEPHSVACGYVLRPLVPVVEQLSTAVQSLTLTLDTVSAGQIIIYDTADPALMQSPQHVIVSGIAGFLSWPLTYAGLELYVQAPAGVSTSTAPWTMAYTAQINTDASQCLSGSFSASTGTVVSNAQPYQQQYQNCIWTITPQNAISIAINVSMVDLGRTDVVQIFGGTIDNGQLLVQLTSQNTSYATLYQGSAIYVMMITQLHAEAHRGFVLWYKVAQAPSATCSGTSRISTAGGMVTSGQTTTAVTCTFELSPVISFSFAHYITLQTGLLTGSNTQVQVFASGSELDASFNVLVASYSSMNGRDRGPRQLTVGATMLQIIYTADAAADVTGWAATFSGSSANGCAAYSPVMNALAGVITDGYNSMYQVEGVSCQFIMDLSAYGNINTMYFWFTNFGLDTGENIAVYAGPPVGSPVQYYMGSGDGVIPPCVAVNGSVMTVIFDANPGTINGFTAQYSIYPPPGPPPNIPLIVGLSLGIPGALLFCCCLVMCCRKFCATINWSSSSTPPIRPPTDPAALEAEKHSVRSSAGEYAGCKLDGCMLARCVEPRTGTLLGYCCREHANFVTAGRVMDSKCRLPGCNQQCEQTVRSSLPQPVDMRAVLPPPAMSIQQSSDEIVLQMSDDENSNIDMDRRPLLAGPAVLETDVGQDVAESTADTQPFGSTVSTPRSVMSAALLAPPPMALDYCCNTHAQMDFPRASRQLVLALPPQHFEYQSVIRQFNTSWKKGAAPSVISIMRIQMAEHFVRAYDKYRESVVQKNMRTHSRGGPGNEHRRFHGSSVSCGLGRSTWTPCESVSCRCCSILRNSLKLAVVRQLNHWGRFGSAHYFSSCASKSCDYPIACPRGAVRMLFLCKVVIGQGAHLLVNQPDLTAPPEGFDSVLGEVGPSLNFDETCVYRDDAVLLKYAIFYQDWRDS